jgi:hypothetical protein
VTLLSTVVRAHPTVDFVYFEHPADVTDGLEAIRILKGVLNSKALASLKCDTVPEVLLQLAPQLSAFPPGHYPGALPLLPLREQPVRGCHMAEGHGVHVLALPRVVPGRGGG